MIQDIAPHLYHVDYTPAAAQAEDILLPVIDGKLCVREDGSFFTCGELSDIPGGPDQFRFLFTIDRTRYYMLRSDRTGEGDSLAAHLPVSARQLTKPEVRSLSDIRDIFAIYTGWHLNDWYRTNIYCSACGSKLEDSSAERCLVCPTCGQLVYPRINPCIIAAVHDRDRLLMTRYAGRDVTWLVLVAGFMEIGESAEDTVRREVLEETGVHVKNIRYFGSQPWGIPGNLTLGYTAELDGDDAITVERNELSEALWVPRGQVPDRVQTDKLSITAAMVSAFHRGEF